MKKIKSMTIISRPAFRKTRLKKEIMCLVHMYNHSHFGNLCIKQGYISKYNNAVIFEKLAQKVIAPLSLYISKSTTGPYFYGHCLA